MQPSIEQRNYGNDISRNSGKSCIRCSSTFPELNILFSDASPKAAACAFSKLVWGRIGGVCRQPMRPRCRIPMKHEAVAGDASEKIDNHKGIQQDLFKTFPRNLTSICFLQLIPQQRKHLQPIPLSKLPVTRCCKMQFIAPLR